MRLPFESNAADELEAVVAWLERERPGHGERFFDEVCHKVERAALLPGSGRSVPGFDLKHDVRQYKLSRFPFSVVTATVDDCRVVIAIAHHRRRPGYWGDRLK